MSKYNNDHKRPLKDDETLNRTIGCRHSNPKFCRKNGQEDVCALVGADNICKAPPSSWEKLFEELKSQK